MLLTSQDHHFAMTVMYLHFFRSFKLSTADNAVWGISLIFKS
jgi:hypothetical protein